MIAGKAFPDFYFTTVTAIKFFIGKIDVVVVQEYMLIHSNNSVTACAVIIVPCLKNYGPGAGILWHRLLCHSLVL
jgi:hypothetical protein